MRQPPNGKRSRNRPGRGNRPQHSRNHTFDSSGPEGKVRGTANQVYEKYLALARDAYSSGDRVTAENFFQHAEHYFRIMTANGQQMRPQTNGFGDDSGDEDADEAEIGVGQSSQQPQSEPQPQPQPQSHGRDGAEEEDQPAPVPERSRPETPAELAQAAAANEGERGGRRTRGPRRSPRRNGEAAAEA